MRILLALLAEHATASTDGRLYVVGGGIRTLQFASFPAIQPRLSVALGIEVGPSELGNEHTLSILAEGPRAELVFRPVKVTFSMPPGPDRARAGYFHFVSNMDNVAFATAGEYGFVVHVDGVEIERVGIRVEQTRDQQKLREAGALQEAEELLSSGYADFGRGNVDAAEATFRRVVNRFPMIATGHNNLGFVLLSKRDATGALEAFAKAKELGYVQDEISDANVACALYLSGDPAAALRGFADCLQTHLFRSTATLFGIGPSELFPVQLGSVGDYASLMALNAAWSAWAANDDSAADHYLASARTADLGLRPDETGRAFKESVDSIASKVPVGPGPRSKG
ncbi:MAG: tetratricopeptide repeat protein [Candidatus Limnocylindrales bacterium]